MDEGTPAELAVIRDQRRAWKEAFESGDVDRIMSFYAPGSATRAFDILPPLQFDGWEAYKGEWVTFLALFAGDLTVEVEDSRITTSGELALVDALVHLTGRTSDGKPFDHWIRGTNGLRKIDGKWLVIHDHVSVPADIMTGRASLDLQP